MIGPAGTPNNARLYGSLLLRMSGKMIISELHNLLVNPTMMRPNTTARVNKRVAWVQPVTDLCKSPVSY